MIRNFLIGLFLLAFSAAGFAETGTLSANGDTESVVLKRPHIHLSGTFGGGTVTCYFADDAGTWRAISDAVFTTADDVTLDFERETHVKCTLAGATTPSLVWVIN